jgi:hypothetical protein
MDTYRNRTGMLLNWTLLSLLALLGVLMSTPMLLCESPPSLPELPPPLMRPVNVSTSN